MKLPNEVRRMLSKRLHALFGRALSRAELSLPPIAGLLAGAVALLTMFTSTLEQKLRQNADKWKKDKKDFDAKWKSVEEAVDWVKASGEFAPAGSGKKFPAAMSVPGGTLASALTHTKLLGILARESSFGTNLGSGGTYVGPFQLSQATVTDYNRHNNPDVTFPGDVDGANDLDTAARVAAWYIAYLLQQLTWKTGDLTAITDAVEANKFALAAYNGGLATINRARSAAKAKGNNPNVWDDVEDELDAGATKNAEIRNYVLEVRAYEDLFEQP